MRHQIFSGLKMGWFTAVVSLAAVAALIGYMWTDKSISFFSRPTEPFHFSPYLDLNLAVQTSTPLTNTFFSANTKASVQLPTSESLKGFTALTLAFASGECGKEHWGGLNAQTLAKANLAALAQAKVGYMVSTGGVDGMFTCSSRDGMATFIERYRSSHLLGFDFNIEAQQTEAMIQNLVHQVGLAMEDNPSLRFSFTLAAIGVGDSNSLNRTGQWVMKAIEKEGLKNYYINLMVMNYGKADLGNCIVRDGQCDMTASAIRAVNNLSRKYHLPLRRIEVTPMIGINDETSNVFTLEDARKLATFAKTYGLGGLHFWSLNRDTPCSGPSASVSATCNSLPAARKLEFTEAFAWLAAPATESQLPVKK
jgi:hypothetical protein